MGNCGSKSGHVTDTPPIPGKERKTINAGVMAVLQVRPAPWRGVTSVIVDLMSQLDRADNPTWHSGVGSTVGA